MNIFEGLLWAIGVLFGLFAIGGVCYWIAKPLVDDDKVERTYKTWEQDAKNTNRAILSSIKRGCLTFVIMFAFILDSCDGKFLT